MNPLATIATIALVVAINTASGAADGKVLVLDQSNFDAALNKHEIILVEFYAPWCGHCKKLEPEYDAAAAQLAGKFPLAKVDATENPGLAGRYGVTGYPTLKLFRSGQPFEYKGGRTTDTIVPYLEKQLLPAAREITTLEELEELKGADTAVFLGVFDSADQAREFRNAAAAMREEADFGIITSRAVAEKLGEGDSVGKIVALQMFDDGRVEADFTGIEQVPPFVRQYNLPVFGNLEDALRKKYTATGMGVVCLFVDPVKDVETMNRFRDLATEFAGKLKFAWADASASKRDMLDLALTGDNVPSVGLRGTDGGHYALEEADVSATRKWLKSFLAGKLKTSIKSEPIPEPNPNSDVLTLVAKTFEREVLRSKDDVLVELYAPWCGHCKKLEPVWEQLATTLKHVSHLKIAKMDATANDLVGPGGGVRGFPTIRFYPANSKTNPITFEGSERELENFIEFLQKHSSKPFSLDPTDSPASKKSGSRRRRR